MVVDIRKEVSWRGRLPEKRHKAVFWGGQNVLYLDGGVGYREFAFVKKDCIYAPCITVYVNHTSTKSNI